MFSFPLHLWRTSTNHVGVVRAFSLLRVFTEHVSCLFVIGRIMGVDFLIAVKLTDGSKDLIPFIRLFCRQRTILLLFPLLLILP